MTKHSVLSIMDTLPLKEMDGSLLTHAILKSSQDVGMSKDVVEKALATASVLHRKATRANRGNMSRTHYIEHPLRNVLRLLRWGVTSETTIVATILHDVVEDCAKEITDTVLGSMPGVDRSETFMRAKAEQYIVDNFGGAVEDVVFSVTNPIMERSLSKDEKRSLYVDHVTSSVHSPEIFLVKFSDWVDNAAGLMHNHIPGNEQMISHLAKKYLPLADVFETKLSQMDVKGQVSEEGYAEILRHIEEGRNNLFRLQQVYRDKK